MKHEVEITFEFLMYQLKRAIDEAESEIEALSYSKLMRNLSLVGVIFTKSRIEEGKYAKEKEDKPNV